MSETMQGVRRTGLRTSRSAWNRSGETQQGSAALGFAVAAPFLLAACFVGVMVFNLFAGPGPVATVTARAADLLSTYSRLYDSDFNDTLRPATQGFSGQAAPGHGLACGIVLTGLGAAADGVRPVGWQRRYGTCPATRMPAEVAATAPSGLPVVVVEVASDPAQGGSYAASIAVPSKEALPVVMAGSRY